MEGTLNERFSQNLSRARRDAGLSQEALAHNADLHRTYVGELERGGANPTLDVVEKLAAALDVDALSLLAESSNG